MQKIPIAAASSDMILEKPVTRDNGMTLVGAGTQLSDSLIQRLENMGIESVVVQGNPLDMGDGSGSYDGRIKRLQHLFRQYKDNVWMQKVQAALIDHYQAKAALEAGTQNMEEEA